MEMTTHFFLACLFAASLISTSWGGLIEVGENPVSVQHHELSGNAVSNEDSLLAPASGDSGCDGRKPNDTDARRFADDAFQSRLELMMPGVGAGTGVAAALGGLEVVERSTPLCYTTSARHVSMQGGSTINADVLRFPLSDKGILEFGVGKSMIGDFLPTMAESFETLMLPHHETWSLRRWKPATAE